jgi:hypothetical protein
VTARRDAAGGRGEVEMGRWAALVVSIVLATSVAHAAETRAAPAARARPVIDRRKPAGNPPPAAPTSRRPTAPSRFLRGRAPVEGVSVLMAMAPFFHRASGWVHVGKRAPGDADDELAAEPAARPISAARLAGQFPGFTAFGSEDVFGRVVIPLLPRLTLWTEYHALRLLRPSDLWYALGGNRRALADAFSGTPFDDARPRAQLLEFGLTIGLREGISAHLHYGRRLEGAGAGTREPAANYGCAELTIRY